MSANGHEESRMDRFERGLEHLLESVARHDVQIGALHTAVEKVLDAQRQLLTAQVVFVDETRKALSQVADAQRKSDGKIQELAGKVDALVGVVDGIVRRGESSR